MARSGRSNVEVHERAVRVVAATGVLEGPAKSDQSLVAHAVNVKVDGTRRLVEAAQAARPITRDDRDLLRLEMVDHVLQPRDHSLVDEFHPWQPFAFSYTVSNGRGHHRRLWQVHGSNQNGHLLDRVWRR